MRTRGYRAVNLCNWWPPLPARIRTRRSPCFRGFLDYVPPRDGTCRFIMSQESKKEARSGVIAIRGPPQETEIPDYPRDTASILGSPRYSVLLTRSRSDIGVKWRKFFSEYFFFFSSFAPFSIMRVINCKFIITYL